MNYIKKIGISILYSMISLFILTLILTIFSYFNIISDDFTSILKILIPIISIIIGSYKLGKNSNKLGYLEGAKYGLICIILLLIFNLIINNDFKVRYLLFYIILLVSSTLGSMIGINNKKSSN